MRLVLHGYALGLMHGALAAALVALVFTAFHATTGSIWQLTGAWGEENTRDVLERAKHRRHIRGWIDSVAIADGDIDHLVVTRDGRLIAIDSKWHAKASKVDWERDAARAERSAQRARSVLRSLGEPWPVSAAVVVWGGSAGDIGSGMSVGDVPILPGPTLKHWLKANDGARVRKQDVDRVLRAVEGFRERVHPSGR
jgi:hypothetical protein